jgi:crotonobetainyl-CoA:carnitine CoA-transferase CaiB-like acyl-CoA transferase
MAAPLAGLRVLELARILAGPWAGQMLADLGAEVIKIESPQGDDTRQWGPPFVTVGEDREVSAAYYHCCNRGKESIVADFTTAEGQALVKSLAANSDVLIENFKVGGLAQYDLDYKSLADLNPRLVYCSITGFGQTGPYASRAGYDFLIQAMGGLMSITGAPDGPPTKVGVALVDIMTGIYAASAIQAALIERHTSGLGQHIDMSLLDVQVATLANQAANYLATGLSPKRAGNDHPNIVPYGVFPASDGDIIIAVGNDQQFRKLCEVLNQPSLANDPTCATNKARVENRAALIPILNQLTSSRTRTELVTSLEAHGVPAGPINTVEDVFSDPQVQARDMLLALEGASPGTTSLQGVRTPIRFSRSTLNVSDRSPTLGEHGRRKARSGDA